MSFWAEDSWVLIQHSTIRFYVAICCIEPWNELLEVFFAFPLMIS